MGVDHCRADVFVTQKLLDRADVVAVFQKMSGKRMAQAMAARRLSDTRFEGCLPHCSLEDRLVDVAPSVILSGKEPSPARSGTSR